MFQKSFWIGSKETVKFEIQPSVEGEPNDVAEHRKTLLNPNSKYLLRVEGKNSTILNLHYEISAKCILQMEGQKKRLL